MWFQLRRLKYMSFMNGNLRKYLSYATGEVVLIILGILIALQIDNLNKRRIERLEEADYLTRLSIDIDLSIETQKRSLEWMKTGAVRAKVVLDSLENCRVPAEEEFDFANGLFQLGKIIPPHVADGTIGEMLATGKQSIIRSTEIRTELNNYLSWRRYVLSFFNEIMDLSRPRQVYVGDQITFYLEENPNIGQEVQFKDVHFDLERLCNDRQFYSAVASARTLAYDAIFWNEGNLRELQSLGEALHGELENLGLDGTP